MLCKINVYNKIVIENQKERDNSETDVIFRNGIHSLLKRTAARGSADIIYRMWRMPLYFVGQTLLFTT